MWCVDSVKGRKLCKRGVGKRRLGCGTVCPVGGWWCGVGENGGAKGVVGGVPCGDGFTNCANQSVAVIAGCMVVAKEDQQVNMQVTKSTCKSTNVVVAPSFLCADR